MIESADSAPEIRLIDLSKHFREVRAVDRVSLDIRSGEFFSMLGPSGCGKTTTLRMIGGFEQPTLGRIELRGRDDIYSKVKFGVTPEINAISTIVVAGTALAILAAWRLGAFGREGRVVTEEDAPRA